MAILKRFCKGLAILLAFAIMAAIMAGLCFGIGYLLDQFQWFQYVLVGVVTCAVIWWIGGLNDYD